MERLTSRKFLLAVAGILFTLVQMGGGAVSSADGLETIKVIILGFLAAEGIGDAAARLGTDASDINAAAYAPNAATGTTGNTV